ncbi:MAG: undecaprenyl/decaprenyl-phosphate alpha-N-acetylglucosaminyl 1-phosphate transferase [Chloroflexota bacterium]|nr:MAG: undecaprenyl/decaprenyl-phosphate alpha-N-acetylglucosaminyl 1-phosphate transferase [Chloroflexota bacterium]
MAIYLLVFATSLLVALAITPVAERLSKRWGVMALPGGRRRHSTPVPKLGGIPVILAYLAGVAVIYWQLPPTGDDETRLQGVILGSLIVFAGGLIDDFRELSPWLQFVIQIAGAAVAISHMIFIEVFTNPVTGQVVWVESRLLVLLITLIWMIGITNMVNWLDGLDGLAAGVGTIAALLFAWHSLRLGQEAVAAFPLALAGALLGFLRFNFAPARIFLGTAGAYVLGYNLATMSILSPAKIATALLVLAVPILDGIWRVADRLRRGKSPFYGDRGHLHFRLADEGVPIRVIVLGYYVFSLAFGLVAIFAPGLFKLALLLLLGALVLALLIRLSGRDA